MRLANFRRRVLPEHLVAQDLQNTLEHFAALGQRPIVTRSRRWRAAGSATVPASRARAAEPSASQSHTRQRATCARRGGGTKNLECLVERRSPHPGACLNLPGPLNPVQLTQFSPATRRRGINSRQYATCSRLTCDFPLPHCRLRTRLTAL